MFPFRFGIVITLIGVLSALFPASVPIPVTNAMVVQLKLVAPHANVCCNMPMGAHCNMPCCRARECCVCCLKTGKPLHFYAGPVSIRPVLPPVVTRLQIEKKICSATDILAHLTQLFVSRFPKPGIPPPK